MKYDFDEVLDRRASDSAKWRRFGEDVLPMWVADMDFPSPPKVIEALQARVAQGFFGYTAPPGELAEVICKRLADEQKWTVTPDQLVYLPGLVCGLNVVTRAIGNPGEGVLVNTPVYPPFLSAPINQGRLTQTADLAMETLATGSGETLRYTLDTTALEAAVTESTRLFILCNPHNPVGRAYTRAELARLGDFCLENDLVICSDEIHADLLLGDTKHHSIAAISPELADRTITLLAPSKTFNLPGLGLSLAVIQNDGLRASFQQAMAGIVPHPNALGYTAALAAYAESGDWLNELRAYLTGNRDYLLETLGKKFPHVRQTSPEATYLGWLDFGPLGLGDNPSSYMLEHAKVALGNGADFGAAGAGFVRLNFGCPRPLLVEGVERIGNALVEAAQA